MKYGSCEVCKNWQAAAAGECPCDECDGEEYFEHMDNSTHTNDW
jgi:hypothetical protein